MGDKTGNPDRPQVAIEAKHLAYTKERLFGAEGRGHVVPLRTAHCTEQHGVSLQG